MGDAVQRPDAKEPKKDDNTCSICHAPWSVQVLAHMVRIPDAKYKKFKKLPISLGELETHIKEATLKLKTKLLKVRPTKPGRCRKRAGMRRRADAARMEEKDMDAMSPSELVLHRRRLSGGARVSPVLAALMEQIEEAQRNH